MAVATVVDAATLYQQETNNRLKSKEQASPNVPIPCPNVQVQTSPSDEIVEINHTTKPVLSKYKIANLSLWYVRKLL